LFSESNRGYWKLKSPPGTRRASCPGSELNRYGHCWPQDFLTASVFTAPQKGFVVWTIPSPLLLKALGALRLVSTPLT
ncbi:MAG: hypothetical protein ACK5DU_08860, partial [Bacteroidota bacterium]